MARIGTRIEVTEESTQQREYENLPDGVYRLEITASEAKESDNPRKFGLKTTMDVIEPVTYKGRKLFVFFNLEHPTPVAQEIGQKQFSCLLRALEMGEAPEDSDELHFHAFTAKIGMGKPSKDGQYAAQNEIKKYYYPDEGNVPDAEVTPPAANDNRPAARPSAVAATAAARPAAATGSKPWAKKAA